MRPLDSLASYTKGHFLKELLGESIKSKKMHTSALPNSWKNRAEMCMDPQSNSLKKWPLDYLTIYGLFWSVLQYLPM